MKEINCELLITEREATLVGFELSEEALIWIVKRKGNSMILNNGQKDVFLIGDIEPKFWNKLKGKKIWYYSLSEKGVVIKKQENFKMA